MDDQRSHLSELLDLEARHDDLLDRLQELDKQVAKVLADCLAVRQPAVPLGCVPSAPLFSPR
jgi:hypothetical protein